MSVILTCNAGSTNIKLAAFDAVTLERKAYATTQNATQAIEWVRDAGAPIDSIGHRVVHGGRIFTHPMPVTDDVLTALEKFIPLAPLHQPAALHLIEETRKLYPKAPHIACFDTAFHHTIPEIERRLPLPRRYHDEGIQRYGFHGLSYQYIASALAGHADKRARGKVVVAHLGGGSSACAMKDLKSVASTMGFSTLDGMMMGTRCGTLDAGVVLHLLQALEMKPNEVDHLLYHESGLQGVSAISANMRELCENKATNAQEAVALYCYLAAKQIASLLPALGGMDMLVFTGGIGEQAASVRENIASLLRWVGDFPVHVIPTDEEMVIARACHELGKARHGNAV